MIGSAAEARFGILIETKSAGQEAFQSTIRHERELIVQLERLNALSRLQAQDTRFLKEAFVGAALEAKRLREEEDRLRAEQERGAAAARKLAAEKKALAQATAASLAASIAIKGAIVATGGAILLASHAAADYQEKLELTAEALGFTTAQIAGMRLAAAESGRTFEQIEPALNVFVRRIGEAAQGNEDALKSFNALDISVKGLDGSIRPTGDLFRSVQQGLAEIEAPAERARLATEFFGRSGVASIAVLMKSVDDYAQKARDMAVAGEGAGGAAAHAADTGFDRLGASVGAVKVQFQNAAAAISGPFVNALADATEMYAKWLALQNQNRNGLTRESAEDLARMARAGMPDTGGGGTKPSKSFMRLFEVGGENFTPFEQSMNLLRAKQDDVRKALDEREKAEKEAAKAAAAIAEIQRRQYNEALEAMLTFKPKIRGAMTPEALEREARRLGGPTEDLTPKGLERFRQQEERDKKRIEEERQRTQALIRSLIGTLSTSFSSFVQSAIFGVGSLQAAFQSMIRSLAGKGIEAGFDWFFSKAFSIGVGAVTGGAGGAVGGGVVDNPWGFGGNAAAVPGRSTVNLTVNVNVARIDSGLNDPRTVQDLANRMAPALGKTLRYNLAGAV